MLHVIGSGFGRTGTLSLKAALETIGLGPCYHMQEVLKRPSHIGAWHDVGRGIAVDWERLFAGFASTVDFPASVVYRQLLDVYPEAKVVHTVRDPDRWYASTYETIYQARTLFPRWMVATVPVVRRYLEMSDALVWDGLFDGHFEDRDHAISVFERHTEEVRAVVPAEQLLEFRVADGWEPLCAFLDRPVPATAFPHVNDRAQMQRRLTAARIGSRALPVVAVGGSAALLWHRRGR
ncbi:MAG: sulfotransferase family protein [Acidimicrobiia bacterium]|nr:sulfotransferase family protein [Acidimicrobiia bacterium]